MAFLIGKLKRLDTLNLVIKETKDQTMISNQQKFLPIDTCPDSVDGFSKF